ncbi:hypothetical protein [Erythrobacter sp.]|uniref:hypothetical protein n=1 Tax=Erythrobacter sp. TaxID=1042 RepID=UPI002ECE4B13|nr:hypothetical protein [Erythrobacter sp.]
MADKTAQKRGGLRLAAPFALGATLFAAIALPSAGMAVAGLSQELAASDPDTRTGFDLFTPPSVDPALAARVAEKSRRHGLRFTPLGARAVTNERTVTVAVRIDDEAAQAISVRKAAETAPGNGRGIAGLQTSRFNLGTARGYQSFARVPAAGQAIADVPVSGRTPAPLRTLGMPDLAQFEPAQPTREDEPSRLQPRIGLEDERVAGRSVNTLDSTAAQTVDLGGSFRLSPNLDVTAGVRYSQERERLDPLTNAQQDSQAVYVGTQIRF